MTDNPAPILRKRINDTDQVSVSEHEMFNKKYVENDLLKEGKGYDTERTKEHGSKELNEAMEKWQEGADRFASEGGSRRKKAKDGEDADKIVRKKGKNAPLRYPKGWKPSSEPFQAPMTPEQEKTHKDVLAKYTTNKIPVGLDRKDNPKMAPLTGEGHRVPEKEFDEASSIVGLMQARGELTPDQAREQHLATMEEGEEDTDPNFGNQTGGYFNNSIYSRYMNADKGTQQLLDPRLENIAPEVQNTNFEVGYGPSDTGIEAEYHPLGPNINPITYGVPLPYIPEVVRDLRKRDGSEYSRGYSQSFALALLAAMGLGGMQDREEDDESVDLLSSIDFNTVPEMEAARRLGRLRTDRDEHGNLFNYRYVYPDQEPTNPVDGEALFRRWFEAAMGARGVDVRDALRQYREPLRRIALVNQLDRRAQAGDNAAKNILDQLVDQTTARRQAWKLGKADEEAAANEQLEALFNAGYDFGEGGLETINNPLDVAAILQDAMSGRTYNRKIDIGNSLKGIVIDSLLHPEKSAPVSAEDLAKTRENYKYIMDTLGDEGLKQRYFPDIIRNKAALLRQRGAKSPLAQAHANRLDAIAQAVSGGQVPSSDDNELLKRWGVEATPQNVLAQLLGSEEAAGNFWKYLNYTDQDGNPISNYFLPRDEYARLMDAESADDVKDLPASQGGLFARRFVDSLADDMRDILAGNDTVYNKYHGQTPTDWQRLRYAIHRAPNEAMKKETVDPATGEVIERRPYKFNDTYSPADLETARSYDPSSEKWSWKSPHIEDMINRIAETGQILPEDMAQLKKMGFVKRGNIFSDYTEDYLNDILAEYGINAKINPNRIGDASLPARVLARAKELKYADMTPEDQAAYTAAVDAYRALIDDNGEIPALYPEEMDQEDAARSAINRLVKKYMGDESYEELGRKYYDPKQKKFFVGDLTSSSGDVLRYADMDEKSMTRPQTYASALNGYFEALGLMNELEEVEHKIDVAYSNIDYANETGEPVSPEEYAHLDKLESDRRNLETSLDYAKKALTYGEEAVSYDENSVKPQDDDETSAASREMDEKRDTIDQNREEGDQFQTDKDILEKEAYDRNPANVPKNLILAIARRMASDASRDYSNAEIRKLGDKWRLVSEDNIPTRMRNWPLFDWSVWNQWQKYAGGDETALDAKVNPEDIAKEESDSLLDEGQDPSQVVNSMLPYYADVDPDDLREAYDIIRGKEEPPPISNLLDKVEEETPLDDDDSWGLTIRHAMPELLPMRDEIYDMMHGQDKAPKLILRKIPENERKSYAMPGYGMPRPYGPQNIKELWTPKYKGQMGDFGVPSLKTLGQRYFNERLPEYLKLASDENFVNSLVDRGYPLKTVNEITDRDGNVVDRVPIPLANVTAALKKVITGLANSMINDAAHMERGKYESYYKSEAKIPVIRVKKA